MENRDNLRRIIIATVISFVFFFAYDYFVLQPSVANQVENNKTIKTTAKAPQNENKSAPVNRDNNFKVGEIAKIEAQNYEITIDSLGRISRYVLKETKFNTEKGKHLELIPQKLPKPLEIRFSDETLNKKAFNTAVTIDKNFLKIENKPQSLTITQDLGTLKIKKVVTFYPNGRYDVKIELSKGTEYYISPGYRPNVAIDQLTIHGALIKKADGTLEIIEDGDAEPESINNAIIAAGFDRYYTTLLFSKKPITAVIIPDEEKNPVLFVKTDKNLELTGYIGPKYVDTLKSIDPELVDVVQYGVGTFFARNLFFVLDWLYKISGNWGIAIILLVVLVRLVLFPLTYKGMVSMYK